MPGATTEKITTVVDLALTLSPTNEPKVTILAGTNDWANGDGPDEIAGGLGQIVNLIKEKRVDAQISVIGLLPRADTPACGISATNERIQEMCTFNDVKYVDPSKVISPKQLAADGVHLKPGGCRSLANLLISTATGEKN